MSKKVWIKVNPKKVRNIVSDLIDKNITAELNNDINNSKWLLDEIYPWGDNESWNYISATGYCVISAIDKGVAETPLNELLDHKKLDELEEKIYKHAKSELAKMILRDVLRKETDDGN